VTVHRYDRPDTNGSKRLDIGSPSIPRPSDPFSTIEYVPPLKRHFALKRIVEEIVAHEDKDQNESEWETSRDNPAGA